MKNMLCIPAMSAAWTPIALQAPALNDEWKAMDAMWLAESSAEPLPKKYLP